jgi:Tfp pilus assembly protein PilV
MYTYPRISEYLECATKEPATTLKNRRDLPHESATSFVYFRVVRFRWLCCRGHRYQQTAHKRCISSPAVSASCALLDWQVTPTKASGFAPEGG